MNNNHPIQPSIGIVAQCMKMFKSGTRMEDVCRVAVQWGADEELEACDALVARLGEMSTGFLTSLRRKSTPQKLKEHALNQLQRIEANIPQNIKSFEASCDTIRQALEALDDN